MKGGKTVTEFEDLLKQNYAALQRFVNYKTANKDDAQDIVQEVCLAAKQKFGTLRDVTLFKPWLLRIAVNKCTDYYRQKARQDCVPLEQIAETEQITSMQPSAVAETLGALDETQRQVLYLYYFADLPQTEIAKILHIPVGTVKSRLHAAKQKFKALYPYPPKPKGDNTMKVLPETMPAYTIEKTEKPPFSVKCEQLAGWVIVPRLGEECNMGMYYGADGRMQGHIETKVVGEAEIYGIRGVEIEAVECDMEDYYRTEVISRNERKFIAQLTDTHSRFLAETHIEDGVRMVHTFVDDDEFTENWGYGEDNCGTPVRIYPKNLIERHGNTVSGRVKPEVTDIVGRYNVTVNGKAYDTVCVMDLNCFNDPVVSEDYLDEHGRTVLWRRFNRDDWAFDRYGKLWSEMLPENERLTVNGVTYVHWYDCITDYIL